MNTISDPQRRPVYFDRANNRFLAEPVGSGPWRVISIEAATGVTLEGLGNYSANTWIGRVGTSGTLQAYGSDAIIGLINAAPSALISGSRMAPASTSESGVVVLNDAVNSTSTTQAATANAVKVAYDLAEAANTAVGGAVSAASAAEANAFTALAAANAASDAAGTAVTTANSASLAASNVLGTANSALAAATAAESLASDAVTTAGTAATVAMTAANDATAAIATANTALSAVETAQSTASTALSTANSALTAADTASTAASAAQTTAAAAESTANAISGTAAAANTTANSALAAASAAQSAVSTALLGSGGTITGILSVASTGSLVFEGATEDDFETRLSVVDPTSDRVLSLPDASGTLATIGSNQEFSGSNTFINTTGQVFRRTAVSDGILLRGSGSGSMANTLEISPASLTQSRTLIAPNVNGTIVTTGDTGTVTNTMLAGSISTSKLSSNTISGVSLGSNLAALTLGTGLFGSSYNGSSGVTVGVQYGTTAGTACQGNDARLSDTRNTANSLTFSNSGNGNSSGSTFNGSAARTISYNSIGAPSTGGAGATGNWNISVSGSAGSVAWSNVSSKPTTLAGFGITDGLSSTANNFFTGSNTFTNGTGQFFRTAANRDAILIKGGSSGSLGRTAEIVPTSLTSSRTYVLPDTSGTIVTTGDSGSVSSAMLGSNAVTDVKVAPGANISGSKIFPEFGAQNVTTNGNIICGNTLTTGSGGTLRFATDGGGGCYIQAGVNNSTNSKANLIFSSINAGTEYARITEAGRLLLGSTSGWGPRGRMKVKFDGPATGTGSEQGLMLDAAVLTTGTRWLEFSSENGTVRGYVDWTGSGVNYSTTSDYRLKENLEPLTGALARLLQLKPTRFNFIGDSSRQVDGFIAHEVQEVVPGAVTGEKDAIGEDGSPIYQGLDASKLVPLLTAAMQELADQYQQKIAALTARVELLEAATAK